jgi:hypothetical protein
VQDRHAHLVEEAIMAVQHIDVLSQFTLAVHQVAGPLTVATWLAVCGGFALEVVPRRDPVERLYRMGAARDELAQLQTRAAHPRELPVVPTARPAPAARRAAPVPAT